MVHFCEACGRSFTREQLWVDGKKARFVTCAFCGTENEIEQNRTKSPVTQGYSYLESGNFREAFRAFNQALVDAQPNISNDRYLDSYIGRALAQFRVQTIYSGENDITDMNSAPQMICWEHSNELFSSNEDYRSAMQSIKYISDDGLQETARRRLVAIQTYVDGVNSAYDQLESKKVEYQLFIVYDEKYGADPDLSGWDYAQYLNKNLQIDADKVFIPDYRERSEDPIRYGAGILYALEHSQAMLAMIVHGRDNFLIDLYSRYITIHGQDQVGFVLCGDRATRNLISIKNQTTVKIFEFNKSPDNSDIKSFVRILVGIVTETEETPDEEDEQHSEPDPDGGKPIVPVMIDNRLIMFGQYPQRIVKIPSVERYFAKFELPEAADAHGWTPLFFDKNSGNPYAWYRDANIKRKMKDGQTELKKYRGIYFQRYRDVTAVRRSNKVADWNSGTYSHNIIHIFSVDPIYWNIIERVESPRKRYTLIPSMSLDCQPFNDCMESGRWDESTLRTWLNSVFLHTAFSEEEQQYLNVLNNEKIFLVDEKRDLKNNEIKRSIVISNIGGTDYFRCMGGNVVNDRIESFWIQSEDCRGKEAKVLFPRDDGTVIEKPSDLTTWPVIPKIYINVK